MTQPENDTLSIVDDKRIKEVKKITHPKDLIDKLPLDKEIAQFIERSRETISNIINLKDSRLLVITWPCSIHNTAEALEYARKIKQWQEENPECFLVMRVYFEKPRTTVWWKWFINDPNLDGSNNMDVWLYEARKLLLEINKMWVPCATEFLDPIAPQYYADLISWCAIGARNVEAQWHRILASGLSMPVWFKNTTEGNLEIAFDAIETSQSEHSFLSVIKGWEVAQITTTWNPDGHIILRWWKNWQNYSEAHVKATVTWLNKRWINTWLIIDVSHKNAVKEEGKEKWEGQMVACEEVTRQVAEWNRKIVWVMIESNLKAWSQKFIPWKDNQKNPEYWVSITDECAPIDWEKWTEKMLEMLNSASSIRLQSA